MRRSRIEQSGLHKKRPNSQPNHAAINGYRFVIITVAPRFRHAEEHAATARGALTNKGLHGKCRQISHNRLAKICPLSSYRYEKDHLTSLPIDRCCSHKLRQTAHLGKRTQNSNQAHTEGSSPPCLGNCLSIFMSCPQDSARSGNVLTSESVGRVKIPPCSSIL